MKRILCLVLCLMLAVPYALAETADTLPKLFVRQLTGGNGAYGYVRINASGVAEWLDTLLPFTAADIWVDAIGQMQGDMTGPVDDDDEWQVRFYVKDENKKETGDTWIYGDPTALYIQSELLPGELLTAPVEKINLLYQLFKGEFSELFFAFDPMDMKQPGENGNASAYQAVANVLGIPAEDWEEAWFPVLEKYFQHLDMWLAGYGDTGFAADESGANILSASYSIPAKDFKDEAKYLIGQMVYDNELQSLLLPHVTFEQRVTFLNPQMVYFYEACIDALELEGNILLSRDMSAMGEVVSTTVELPLPKLPDTLIAPVNEAAQKMLGLPYGDLLAGMNRLSVTRNGKESELVLSGEKRSIKVNLTDASQTADASELSGTLQIGPAEGQNGVVYLADLALAASHHIGEDEKYKNHDTTKFSVEIKPILPPGSETSEFKPFAFSLTADYINDPYKQNSPVQVNLDAAVKLPDAEVSVEAVMRITTKVAMKPLTKLGGEDMTAMTGERKTELVTAFVNNAAETMAGLFDSDPAAEAEPTAVPPAAE